ncbi:MAG: phosphate ABC transporter ATP-binding protein, partial [Solirubrobacteraceae bacterium]|nr:phosphate ABC transporter ATP-binding protein [Solirubrobacteraceae bacterium]
ISTGRIEELMLELRENYTIVIVTHNMQQAGRVSDRTAFFTVEQFEGENRVGLLAEFNPTQQLFTAPEDPRTEAYISGKFG